MELNAYKKIAARGGAEIKECNRISDSKESDGPPLHRKWHAPQDFRGGCRQGWAPE